MKERPSKYNQRALQKYSLKPTPIPDGFVLVQDTREQLPLFTRLPSGLTIMSKKLNNGDYSVLGLENKIAFERKSSDLFAYCTVERDKTVAKMKRFKSYEFVGLVIEMKEIEAYQFQAYTKVHPESIRGAITSFQVRYGVHVYWGSREQCGRYIMDCATKFYTMKHEVGS